ncbi:MAG: hypothetical protein KC584_08725, partial [Nitrospira sp.]|nr:hypothetical protein [Nitrospira sp.]
MKTSESSNHVPVSLGDRSYQVLIQPHILPQIGRVLQDVGLAGRVAIVTNPVVNEIYGRVVFRSLKRCGFSP